MSRVLDIWNSYRALPIWVQIWVGLILVPANLASVFFLSAPNGIWIALLAVGGMAPNAVFMVVERGFSRIMAISHLILWTPLLVLLWPQLGAPYATLLFAINAISLVFDVKDTWEWMGGKRDVAGAECP